MYFIVVAFIISLVARKSQAYVLDPVIVTNTLINETVSEETPTPMTVPAPRLIVGIESDVKNPPVQKTTGTISVWDALDLCKAVTEGDYNLIESNERKLYYYIPLVHREAANFYLPRFNIPCFRLKRAIHVGTPKSPFDSDLPFWVPSFENEDDVCGHEEDYAIREKRKRANFESITLSSFEAISLCAMITLFDLDYVYHEVNYISLPTNVASEFRCTYWKNLAPQNGWVKIILDKHACELMNKQRPTWKMQQESYNLDNMKNDSLVIAGDLFEKVVRCEYSRKKIDCKFI